MRPLEQKGGGRLRNLEHRAYLWKNPGYAPDILRPTNLLISNNAFHLMGIGQRPEAPY